MSLSLSIYIYIYTHTHTHTYTYVNIYTYIHIAPGAVCAHSTNYTNAAAARQDARLGAQSGGEETTVIEQILSSVRHQVSRRA